MEFAGPRLALRSWTCDLILYFQMLEKISAIFIRTRSFSLSMNHKDMKHKHLVTLTRQYVLQHIITTPFQVQYLNYKSRFI